VKTFLALLSLLAAAGAQGEGYESRVLSELGNSKNLAVLDRRYLQERPGYEKFFGTNSPPPHRLVRAALDHPLTVSREALLSARRILGATGSTALHALRPYVRITAPEEVEDPAPGTGLEKVSPRIRETVGLVHAMARRATREVETALEQLTAEDREFLKKELPRFLGRTQPEGKQRAQKGIEDVAERERLMHCAQLWEKVDRAALARAMGTALAAAEVAAERLKGERLNTARIRIETPEGPILLRGNGNQGGDDDALIVIDFGGDDEHRMPEKPSWRPVRIVVDLDGDDLYLAKGNHAWGSALLGVSVHLDAAGNDDYRAKDWSLGCGLGGLGILWDQAGRDRYEGGLGVMGTGVLGAGVLLDDRGHDTYTGGLFCQGFASTGGVGALLDRSGDDSYRAGRDDPDIWRRAATFITFAQGSAYGHRFGHIYTDDQNKRRWKMTGQLPGGVGLLFDGGGHDTYHADVFGQGAGYWYSLGLLVDLGGNDEYRTTWYGQGVGTHAAVGCVVDASGNDFYQSRNTSQGCGHDFSVGILHDLKGNDEYRGLNLCQGAGNAPSSLGLLIDEQGDDRYHCPANSWGYGSTVKQKPELAPWGFFLDLAGSDRYTGRERPKRDAHGNWKQGERGVGIMPR